MMHRGLFRKSFVKQKDDIGEYYLGDANEEELRSVVGVANECKSKILLFLKRDVGDSTVYVGEGSIVMDFRLNGPTFADRVLEGYKKLLYDMGYEGEILLK